MFSRRLRSLKSSGETPQGPLKLGHTKGIESTCTKTDMTEEVFRITWTFSKHNSSLFFLSKGAATNKVFLSTIKISSFLSTQFELSLDGYFNAGALNCPNEIGSKWTCRRNFYCVCSIVHIMSNTTNRPWSVRPVNLFSESKWAPQNTPFPTHFRKNKML